MIGSALRARLTNLGCEVIRIGRFNAAHPPDVRWSVPHGQLSPTPLENLHAVVHLAGEPIVGKWTRAKKQSIRDSRVRGTRLLAATLAGLQKKPGVLISASAIGYYGDRGDAIMDESSTIGAGFLPEVSRDWEAATLPAARAGIRVVHPRLGVVIAEKGGALKQMLPAFRLGLGGPLGNGAHWMSWISLDDTVGAILHLINNKSVSGPVNLVSPQPVTNKVFTRNLAAQLRRPAFLPAPRFAVRMAFGELADEALFASQRVVPGVLEQSGYTFTHQTLEAALRAALG